MFVPPGVLSLSGDIFDGHDRVEGAAGTWCAEATDAGKSPTTHGAALTIEGYTRNLTKFCVRASTNGRGGRVG